MNTEQVAGLYEQYILPTYRQQKLCITRGKGSRVWDIHGKMYLDFFPGWAVSGLGHAHPAVVHAIKHQALKILHVPNNFMHVKQAQLAQEIVTSSFDGKVFFSNSGAEANEAAIKCARRFGASDGRYEIITFEGSFHGRTFGALSATAQARIQEGFGPMLEGFRYARLNDLASVEKLLGPKTVAIMLEPIQGEGGIQVVTPTFLATLKKIASDKNLLLIFDEIQTGMGRTGTLFAYEQLGVVPDIMTLAKSLGNGVPIGATVVSRRCADLMGPGSHGSTYGGNPLVSAAALAVFKAIGKHRLLQHARKQGAYLREKLEALKNKYAVMREVRGLGLMLGVELTAPAASIVDQCRARGLLINCTQEKVLRIMPAITVTKGQIDQAARILDKVFSEAKL